MPFNSPSSGDSNVHEGLRTTGLDDIKVPFRSMLSVLNKVCFRSKAKFPWAAKTINWSNKVLGAQEEIKMRQSSSKRNLEIEHGSRRKIEEVLVRSGFS